MRLAVRSLSVSKRLIHIHGVQGFQPKPYDPLRILFCGADDFSIASLRMLWDLSQANQDKVESIDVVCRPDKRVGRGLKKIQQVPIKGVANELGLKLHQLDTFTGWQPPESINLVVAVSFGLLVPARIINGAKYGGLNVHPSLLPDLRGPAPIQHAIMKGRQYTGVTLQTMHPTRFDNGAVLAQTKPEDAVVGKETTTIGLTSTLSVMGAEMLRESVGAGIFVDPVKDIGSAMPKRETDLAPKVTPEDRHIDWNAWTADVICRRDRAVGSLWDLTIAQAILQKKPMRLSFVGPWTVLRDGASDVSKQPGSPIIVSCPGEQDRLGIHTADGHVVSPSTGTLEGSPRGTGIATLIRAMKATGQHETMEFEKYSRGLSSKLKQNQIG